MPSGLSSVMCSASVRRRLLSESTRLILPARSRTLQVPPTMCGGPDELRWISLVPRTHWRCQASSADDSGVSELSDGDVLRRRLADEYRLHPQYGFGQVHQ